MLERVSRMKPCKEEYQLDKSTDIDIANNMFLAVW